MSPEQTPIEVPPPALVKKQGLPKPRHRAQNREAQQRRREEAAVRAKRVVTPEQQLARLDALFGAGLGAVKERAKLAKRMAQTPPPKAEPPKKRPKKARDNKAGR